MIAFLIRVISFFMKEFHDVRRQPLLMVSLVGGPLLVLSAFGLTFKKSNPFITTVLVWPENGIPGISQQDAEKFIGDNFFLIDVTSDREKAMQWLDDGAVDVVQIVPEFSASFVQGGKRPEIEIYSRTVDPTTEAWTRSLAYGEANYINKLLLSKEANLAQQKAVEISASLESAQEELTILSRNLDAQKLERAEQLSGELRTTLEGLMAVLPPMALAQANLAPELSNLYRDVNVLLDDLNELEEVLRDGDLAIRLERMQSASSEIGNLQLSIDIFVDTPAENIISPVRETYTNLRGNPYSMVVFYAPSVLALLVQQLAITLASLGLVRERQMGAFEMFRVSPLRFSEILIGKSLAYILYVTIVGLILTGLLSLIDVPMPFNPGGFLVLMVITATASVGIGSLISAMARSDSQAVQMTMLVLLMSIFFTGFFLPITGFAWPAWIIYALLPMSSAISGFKHYLLIGTSPLPVVWVGLGLITLISYGLVLLIMRRQYRKVLD